MYEENLKIKLLYDCFSDIDLRMQKSVMDK